MNLFGKSFNFVRVIPKTKNGLFALDLAPEDYLERLGSGEEIVQGNAKAWIVASPSDDSDKDWSLEKNYINGALVFGMAVLVRGAPGDIKRRYVQQALKTMFGAKDFYTRAQKTEARDEAFDRIRAESSDGRWDRVKVIPVLWDLENREILLGGFGDKIQKLFWASMGKRFPEVIDLFPLLPGQVARDTALEPYGLKLDGLTDFRIKEGPGDIVEDGAWWDSVGIDWLGNEFLLWLAMVGRNSDTFGKEKGEIQIWFEGTISLEDPREKSEKQKSASTSSTSLNSLWAGVAEGKIPRSASFQVVADDEAYGVTLQGDRWEFAGVTLPEIVDEDKKSRAYLEARVDQLRKFHGIFWHLYQCFLAQRLRDPKGWREFVTNAREKLKTAGCPK